MTTFDDDFTAASGVLYEEFGETLTYIFRNKTRKEITAIARYYSAIPDLGGSGGLVNAVELMIKKADVPDYPKNEKVLAPRYKGGVAEEQTIAYVIDGDGDSWHVRLATTTTTR